MARRSPRAVAERRPRADVRIPGRRVVATFRLELRQAGLLAPARPLRNSPRPPRPGAWTWPGGRDA